MLVGIYEPNAGGFKCATPFVNRSQLWIATAGFKALHSLSGCAGVLSEHVSRPAEQSSSRAQLLRGQHGALGAIPVYKTDPEKMVFTTDFWYCKEIFHVASDFPDFP
jgi:hypothetical protein